ncbi:MAG: hypothetical protein R3B54_15195 [Bdellovibrionota bacterium]
METPKKSPATIIRFLIRQKQKRQIAIISFEIAVGRGPLLSSAILLICITASLPQQPLFGA